jgi:nicotinate phosphoribosyltransferase
MIISNYIADFLDNDLYKITMMQAVIRKFPDTKVKYQFFNRDNRKFPPGFGDRLRELVNQFGLLGLSSEGYDFLQKMRFMSSGFLQTLKNYRYDPQEVIIEQNDHNLEVRIEGYWFRTILWEVPLMALISQLYFEMTGEEGRPEEEVMSIMVDKAQYLRELKVYFADFGTRRRKSLQNHHFLIMKMKENAGEYLVGTSNVYMAMMYGLKAIGTHAHEYFSFHGAKYGYKMANRIALQHWVDVYQGCLGIALSDTFTSEVFLKSFDTLYAKLFDGVRHDSGDPLEFGDQIIKHYQKLGIDPQTKSIVFSDGLNMEEVARIHYHFQGRIKYSFGIGTNFTNDVGVKPLNIVIKMVEAEIEGDWYPTIKLSDNVDKHTGDKNEIQLAKQTLRIF